MGLMAPDRSISTLRPGDEVRGRVRLHAQGPADDPRRLGLPGARAARSQRQRPGARVPRRRRAGRRLRAGRSGPGRRHGRALPRRARGGGQPRSRASSRASADADPTRFLPTAYRDLDELDGFLEHLAPRGLRPGLPGASSRRCSATERCARRWRRAPCTRGGHHAYLGGLLEHTVAVATLAHELCQLHPRLNSDLLLTAAIVHDLGRTREFTLGAEIGISEEGRLLGHIVIGERMIAERARGARRVPAAGAAALRALPPRPALGARRPLRLAGGGRAVPRQRARRLGQGRAGARPALSAGAQPIAGATCSAIVCSSRALYSTPSWLGTVSSTVSASRTASSRASSSAIDVRLAGVGAAEARDRVVDEADGVAVPAGPAAEVRPVLVGGDRDDAAAHRHPRLVLVAGVRPRHRGSGGSARPAARSNGTPVSSVSRVELIRFIPCCGGPLRGRAGAGTPPDAVAPARATAAGSAAGRAKPVICGSACATPAPVDRGAEHARRARAPGRRRSRPRPARSRTPPSRAAPAPASRG